MSVLIHTSSGYAFDAAVTMPVTMPAGECRGASSSLTSIKNVSEELSSSGLSEDCVSLVLVVYQKS